MTDKFPWKRALGESLFILLGILGAFWIDAWWDGHQDEKLRAGLVEAARAEAVLNRASLIGEIEAAGVRQEAIDEFFRMAPDSPPDVPPGAVRGFITRLMNPRTFEPVLGSAQVLLEAPIGKEGDVRARALLNRWIQGLADAEDRRLSLFDHSEEVLRLMAAHAPAYVSEGRRHVPGLLARGGPDILHQLRADDDLVQALTLKSHWQEVYTLRLEAGVPLLDSLIVELGGPQ